MVASPRVKGNDTDGGRDKTKGGVVMLQKKTGLGVVAIINILILSGCGQAMLSHKLNALNEKFEKRLQIKEISLPPIEFGEQYNAQLEAMGGTPPYKWRVLSGQLPRGLQLEESTGKIFGTPQSAGNNPIVVVLTDSSGNPNDYVVQSFSLK